MAEQEIIAPGSEAGASVEGEQKAAEQPSQEAGKSQSSEQTSVGSLPTNATSVERRERTNGFNGATRRILEDVVSKSLDARLAPLLERLEKIQTPPAQTSSAPEPIDLNDLPGWIQRQNATAQERLEKRLLQTLQSFKGEVKGELKNVSKTQEARNYLISQQDVGQDQQRLEEIEQVMVDNGWHYMAEHEPLKAVQLGYKAWKESKKNGAPSKSQLSGITGGAGTTTKRGPTAEQIKSLEARIIANPTVEESQKIEAELKALLAQGSA